ncbi:MAG: hypothetical protein QF486_04930 [Candidatus Woesearchaeota archaeon]|jgi:hypothetical protein|nr:hypothetical protein [Candidatus Woesearchaeota archaeon]MDP7182013.1 hypothetical protein [Candidatus Woesearchaeota archaeon]MDP7198935.1 hypothetical protein [Candidatus Woesearchaeota archaeon]MDP7467313.1 hypothetical protein [Candidatus Woesearchaeota archaeon]MDP7646632.1 hypothetical protein [Candidatus Woesearchaeota archaeon]
MPEKIESTSLMLGVGGLILFVLFLLQQLDTIKLSRDLSQALSDTNLMWLFAICTLLLSLQSLSATIGLFGVRGRRNR